MTNKIKATLAAIALMLGSFLVAGNITPSVAQAATYPVCTQFPNPSPYGGLITRCSFTYPWYAQRAYVVCRNIAGQLYAAVGPWVGTGQSSGARCIPGYGYYYGWPEEARY